MSKYTGARFGAVVVVDVEAYYTAGGNYKQRAKVRCDCGVVFAVALGNLRVSKDLACAVCRKRKHSVVAAKGYKHPLYKTWWGMLCRCLDPNVTAYVHYGQRGISVCPRWRGDVADGSIGSIQGFHAFVEDMGPRPPGTSLDRINNDGNYEPGNCRWADWETQGNNKRGNRRVALGAQTKTVAQWGRVLGVPGWAGVCDAYGVSLETGLRLLMERKEQGRIAWGSLLAPYATKQPPSQKKEKVFEPRTAFEAWLDSLEG